MSYLVIARKWRPQTFEEVVGQSHVTRTLQNAISAGRVAHGYLFTGPRGVGKTTTARILAKALNCEKGPTPTPCLVCPSCLEIAGTGGMDVIEIDGASNRGVDDIRSLRENVQYSGSRDRHKVYIIDEVHMLTKEAFNALLKTLEEPPPHVIFIFATTEVDKIPPTILSRVQRFDFRRVGSAELSAQLRKILTAEGLEASDEALQMVSRAGAGSVRDSQTLLDQVISFALGGDEKRALRAEDVLAVLGGVPEGQALIALRQALTGESQAALLWLQAQYQRGADLRQVLEAFQQLLRGLLLAKAGGGDDADLLAETRATLKELSHGLGLSRLFSAIKACGEAETQLRYSSNVRLVMELLILQLAPAAPGASLGELVDELAALERRLLKSATEAPSAPAPTPKVPETAPAPVAVIPAQAGEPKPVIESLEEAAPSTAAWTVERLRAEWHAVMDHVRPNSLNLATSAQDAELVSFTGGVLTLRVGNSFQRRNLEDAPEKARLEQALSDQVGQPVKVTIAFAEPVKKKASDGKPDPEEVAKLLKEHPGIRRAQEMFGGEIVEIRND